jgi:hypothetical protein
MEMIRNENASAESFYISGFSPESSVIKWLLKRQVFWLTVLRAPSRFNSGILLSAFLNSLQLRG